MNIQEVEKFIIENFNHANIHDGKQLLSKIYATCKECHINVILPCHLLDLLEEEGNKILRDYGCSIYRHPPMLQNRIDDIFRAHQIFCLCRDLINKGCPTFTYIKGDDTVQVSFDKIESDCE
jgi:hypothetical protein